MEQNRSVMLSLELLMRTQSQLGIQDVQRFTQQLMQRYPHIYSIQFLKRFRAAGPGLRSAHEATRAF